MSAVLVFQIPPPTEILSFSSSSTIAAYRLDPHGASGTC
jgi:hypothetical protein